MGLLSAIGRAVPVVVGGAAAAWYLRRQGYLGGQPTAELPAPIDSTAAEVESPPIEAHAEAVAAVSDASDVSSVVEDLLAAAPGEEPDSEAGSRPD